MSRDIEVILDDRMPEHFALLIPKDHEGLTPWADRCTLVRMADTPTPTPANSMAASAAFFDPEATVFDPATLAPRTTSVEGPFLYARTSPKEHPPGASIIMKRTRRLGRQRWTWFLRENRTLTRMCRGNFYANYDEAVEAAVRVTRGGYEITALVLGDKPRGRS